MATAPLNFSAALFPTPPLVLAMSCTSGLFALLPPCALLQQLVSSVGEESELALLHARKPVAKAATNSGEDGVDPERFLIEEWAHFNAELP